MEKHKYTSKRSFLNSSNVDRRFLAYYVYNKINKSIPIHHISAVISILFEELIKDLIEGRIITIGNFGKFFLRKMLPRRHYDMMHRTIKVSKGNKILRFQFFKDIQRFLTNNLDVAKTFEEHHNE